MISFSTASYLKCADTEASFSTFIKSWLKRCKEIKYFIALQNWANFNTKKNESSILFLVLSWWYSFDFLKWTLVTIFLPGFRPLLGFRRCHLKNLHQMSLESSFQNLYVQLENKNPAKVTVFRRPNEIMYCTNWPEWLGKIQGLLCQYFIEKSWPP